MPQARAQAQVLQAQGLEVRVYGVPAYSTLGWLNWAGGDPLLNTFINQPHALLTRDQLLDLSQGRELAAFERSSAGSSEMLLVARKDG